jgi:hypothetical protein
VPSEKNFMMKYFPDAVPVAKVPVDLNPCAKRQRSGSGTGCQHDQYHVLAGQGL